MQLVDYDLEHQSGTRGQVRCQARLCCNGEELPSSGLGNGPINAFVHALESTGLKNFNLTDYRSHAVRGGSDADSAAYVQLKGHDGRIVWGVGVDPSIEMAGLRALVSAWNLLHGQ